jgi:alcohol dehydrogenase class IV
VVLPHAVAYNAPYARTALAGAARALGVADAGALAGALYDLAVAIGAPTSLASLGMPESGIERAVDLATEKAYPNPRPLERDAIRALLHDARAGARPRSGV